MTVPSENTSAAAPRRPRPSKETVLIGAVDVARAAVEELVDPTYIGEHQGARVEGERLVTHVFASLQPGYKGWQWAVTVARPPRGRVASVCEVSMLPGDGALLAPTWVPWAERLEPGDLGPGDVLPYEGQDVRLVPGFTDTSEDADQLEIDELGLGRVRVLSREGFDRAATRWYEGKHGPDASIAQAATSKCASCGFFLKMAGTPRNLFGVCANEWSPQDGRVVSVDHGCGAHSETDVPARPPLWNAPETVLDESELDSFELPRPQVEEPAEDEQGDAAEQAEQVEKAVQEDSAKDDAAQETTQDAEQSTPDVEATEAEDAAQGDEQSAETEMPGADAQPAAAEQPAEAEIVEEKPKMKATAKKSTTAKAPAKKTATKAAATKKSTAKKSTAKKTTTTKTSTAKDAKDAEASSPVADAADAEQTPATDTGGEQQASTPEVSDDAQ